MSLVKANIARGPRTYSFLVVFGLLALVLSVPFMVRASYGAAPTSVSMSYTEKQVGSQTVLYVTLNARDTQLPSQIFIALASYFNGSSTVFNYQYIVGPSGNGVVSKTFMVPFVGAGNYLFMGSIRTSASGTLLLRCIIDPHIEPEWK